MKRYIPLFEKDFSQNPLDDLKFFIEEVSPESSNKETDTLSEDERAAKLNKIKVGLDKIGLHILNNLQQSGLFDNELLQTSGKAIVMFPIMYIEKMLVLSEHPDLFNAALREMGKADANIKKIFAKAKYRAKLAAVAKRIASSSTQTTNAIKSAQSNIKRVYSLKKASEEENKSTKDDTSK